MLRKINILIDDIQDCKTEGIMSTLIDVIEMISKSLKKKEQIMELNTISVKLIQSFENKDYTMMIDVLKYELKEIVKKV